jgi:hypothetical protein
MPDTKIDHYGLTEAEWVVAEILHEGCWCEHEEPGYDGCGPWSRGKDARRVVAALNGPESTWRDIFVASRKAGWTRRGSSAWSMWGIWGTEDIDDSCGWVIAHRIGKARRVTVVGPGSGPMNSRSFTELVDPTPAKILTALGLVGLGGGDER